MPDISASGGGGGGFGGWMLPQTFPGLAVTGTSYALGANLQRFFRVFGSGVITKIGIYVGTENGNLAVAVYNNSGVGRSATPSTRKGTSGSVACPSAGYAEVALTASTTVSDGDWFCVWVDGTAALHGSGTTGDAAGAQADGMRGYVSSALAPPATAAALTATNLVVTLMNGIP